MRLDLTNAPNWWDYTASRSLEKSFAGVATALEITPPFDFVIVDEEIDSTRTNSFLVGRAYREDGVEYEWSATFSYSRISDRTFCEINEIYPSNRSANG